MFFTRKKHEVICVGSTSKDIFFPTGEGVILDTPEDLTAQKKIAFELGGKIQVDDRYEAVGGVAANVAQGLAKLGIDAAVYSNIGSDETGKWITKVFDGAGVATDRLSVDNFVSSDLSAIVVATQTGDRTIFHNRDANERLRVLPEKLEGSEWIFVSALNGNWRENLSNILESSASNGSKVAINPGQHNLREDPELMLSAIAKSEILILNKDEALELIMKSRPDAGPEDLNDEAFLLSKLSEAGAKIVGMTDGARGAWGFDGNEMWYCPIGHVERVVDSTGAGDSFGAAFFAAHISGKSLPEMLSWGIAESGSVVSEYGASKGLLSRSEIESRIGSLSPEKIR